MKIWLLYESYWDDSHNYLKGITTNESTAIHWKNTKPKGLPSRDIVLKNTVDSISELDKTVNTEEHRKYYEVLKC